MAIPIATITASIAGLTVTGLTIRDTGSLSDHIEHRDEPCMVARPNGFVTFSPTVRDTYGLATIARKTQVFTLAYRLFYADAGEGRGMYDLFPGFVTMIFALQDALIAADALGGTIDMQMIGNPSLGIVQDGADGNHWGCDINIQCTVFINN
jgi:hypothetical protein